MIEGTWYHKERRRKLWNQVDISWQSSYISTQTIFSPLVSIPLLFAASLSWLPFVVALLQVHVSTTFHPFSDSFSYFNYLSRDAACNQWHLKVTTSTFPHFKITEIRMLPTFLWSINDEKRKIPVLLHLMQSVSDRSWCKNQSFWAPSISWVTSAHIIDIKINASWYRIIVKHTHISLFIIAEVIWKNWKA